MGYHIKIEGSVLNWNWSSSFLNLQFCCRPCSLCSGDTRYHLSIPASHFIWAVTSVIWAHTKVHRQGEGKGKNWELKSTINTNFFFFFLTVKKLNRPVTGKTYVLLRTTATWEAGRRGRQFGPTPSIFPILQMENLFISARVSLKPVTQCV